MELNTTSLFSHSTLRALLGQLSDGILLIDRGGAFLYSNAVADRLLDELTPTSAGSASIGTPFRGGQVRRPLPIDGAVARALLIGEVVRQNEIACETRDGRRRWVSICATPVRDARGETDAVVVTFADVTALRERDQFAPIMESLARL